MKIFMAYEVSPYMTENDSSVGFWVSRESAERALDAKYERAVSYEGRTYWREGESSYSTWLREVEVKP